MLLFHTFWLVICKLMRIRIQLPYHFDVDAADADPDPTFQCDVDS
jgi:hypothetical protein